MFQLCRFILEHLLEVLKDGLLEVLTLLDVKSLKFFPNYPGNLLKVLLGHINLKQMIIEQLFQNEMFNLSLILCNLLSQSIHSILLASKFSFHLRENKYGYILYSFQMCLEQVRSH